MSDNDQIILDSVLQQQRQQLAPELSEAEFFEGFASEQALKDYDLSYEEIRSGIVDGGGDGGIDGIYVIANGELVHEDSDLSQLKKGVQLDLVVVQSTTSAGFSESRLDRLTAATEDLFDLSKPLSDFKTVYNEAVLRETEIFRDTQQSLASRFPQLRVTACGLPSQTAFLRVFTNFSSIDRLCSGRLARDRACPCVPRSRLAQRASAAGNFRQWPSD
ncbi:MAG TPA: hypothetical protein VKE51_21970 [Vicinamibacterales bacterium]|nr:hypothetical protein [Vicinamibacterales bacterium]